MADHISKPRRQRFIIDSHSASLLLKVLAVLEDASEEEGEGTILTIGDSPYIGSDAKKEQTT